MTAKTKTRGILEPIIEKKQNSNYLISGKIKKDLDRHLKSKGFYIYSWLNLDIIKKYISEKYISYISMGFSILIGILFIIISQAPDLNLRNIFYSFYAVIFFGILMIPILLLIVIWEYIKSMKDISIFGKILITKRGLLFGGQVYPYETLESLVRKKRQLIKRISQKYRISFFGIAYKKPKMDTVSNIKSENNPGFGYLWSFFVNFVYYFTFPIFSLFGLIIGYTNSFISSIFNPTTIFLNTSSEKVEHLSKEINKECCIIKENIKTGTFEKITTSFKKIGDYTKEANDIGIQINKKFKTYDKSKDIFDLSKFQDWMKSEIKSPFLELQKTLHSSTENNTKALSEIELLIEKQTDSSLKNTLILQKQRLEMQKIELEKYQNILQSYITKLG